MSLTFFCQIGNAGVTTARACLTIAMLMLLGSGAWAQERLMPLSTNAGLTALDEVNPALWRSGSSRDTICLPFFDDFSNPRRWLGTGAGPCTDTVYPTGPGVYPNALLWSDRGAFINATYPVDPPTYGVATLDGLNSRGKPYNTSNPYGPADTLTSRPLYLGGPLEDSLFLSFYYQPSGTGDPPEPQDSLLLEFRRPDSTWQLVWATTNLEGAFPQPFRLVTVNVAESQFRYDGFQFRFRNYATRSGNNDHWHIDYVLLNQDRSRGDTLFRDVAFSEPPTSMLRRYHSMPWRHFQAGQAQALRSQMAVRARNLFNAGNNTNFQDSLLELSSQTLVGLTPSESAEVPANGYYTFFHNNFEVPPGTPGFAGDSLVLQWNLRLRPSGDIDAFNDTLLIRQPFYNYFAYDDGSAERAYGLIGLGARLAYRFEAAVPDSVYAVYMHWAYVQGPQSDKFFSLRIYHSIDTTGNTGLDSVLYQEDFLAPSYPDSVNGWWVYNLRQPVPVEGIFYIGWLQSQDGLLNIGFDRNTDASSQLFFNLGDVWIRSSLPGTVMMRPQVGPNFRVYPTLGLDGVNQEPHRLRVWPNPSSDRLYLELPHSGPLTYRLYDLLGVLRSAGPLQDAELSLADFPPGPGFVELQDRQGTRWVARFVRSQ